MAQELREAGVSAEHILDAAIDYYMPQCDFALVGAELVCVDGGIIAKVSSECRHNM